MIIGCGGKVAIKLVSETRWPKVLGDEVAEARSDLQVEQRKHTCTTHHIPNARAKMALSLYMQYDSEWRPACDVCESADCIQLIADLPGVARESVKVSVEDGLLVISGERRRSSSIEGRYHAAERGQGKFKQLLTLPKGDALQLDRLDYQLSEGVLLVTIPKKRQ